MTINVKNAVNSAQTYQELLSITEQLHAGLSSYGCRYAVITAQSPLYQGTIAIGAVAEKAMKIRERMEEEGIRFTSEEKENVTLLCREISRLYGEDTINCAQVDRPTTVLIFIMSIIFWTNHQSKWSDNRNGLSYREQLQQPLSIRLKTVVKNAQNYRQLLPIANKLHAGLSYWGYQYAYAIPSSLYKGTIPIGAVAEKAMEIRERMEREGRGFNTDEMESVSSFCCKVDCLYLEDKARRAQANIITTICRLIARVLFQVDHQTKWGNGDQVEKTTTYPEILCRSLPGSIYERPLRGGSSEFERKLSEWRRQGITYIPYPDGI
ncbi:MAG: hypothetical protein ACRCU0_01590 [Candidatus Rhabdochlamydia sp.]